MLGVLSMRLREFTVQIENLSLKEVPGRLSSYLLYLSDEQETQNTVKLAISKSQLASLLGTIPETLSRIFTKMAAARLISVQGGDIQLLDRSALENLAENGKLPEK
jgi:CRP/FNR family transcriptional regulator